MGEFFLLQSVLFARHAENALYGAFRAPAAPIGGGR
jgi:hypothetical protein